MEDMVLIFKLTFRLGKWAMVGLGHQMLNDKRRKNEHHIAGSILCTLFKQRQKGDIGKTKTKSKSCYY